MKLILKNEEKTVIEIPEEAIEKVDEELDSIALKQDWVEGLSIREFKKFFAQFDGLEEKSIISVDFCVEDTLCAELPYGITINSFEGKVERVS